MSYPARSRGGMPLRLRWIMLGVSCLFIEYGPRNPWRKVLTGVVPWRTLVVLSIVAAYSAWTARQLRQPISASRIDWFRRLMQSRLTCRLCRKGSRNLEDVLCLSCRNWVEIGAALVAAMVVSFLAFLFLRGGR